MNKFNLKTEKEIEIMAESGKRLYEVKSKLKDAVKPGVTAFEIETLANELIEKTGAEASFSKVPGYKWATCINGNEGVVHGIPHKEIVFTNDDIVSVDVGLVYNKYHSDTSFSKYLGKDPKKKKFLDIGKRSLEAGISQFKEGNLVEDIPRAMETVLRQNGLNPFSSLTGHGIGKNLHEDPRVPCMILGSEDEQVQLVPGMVLAIEVMYTEGKDKIKVERDGWTISTKDDKMAALWEETVALTSRGRIILTQP